MLTRILHILYAFISDFSYYFLCLTCVNAVNLFSVLRDVQEVQDRRPVKDIAYLFKRAVLLEKGRRDRRKDITPGRAR